MLATGRAPGSVASGVTRWERSLPGPEFPTARSFNGHPKSPSLRQFLSVTDPITSEKVVFFKPPLLARYRGAAFWQPCRVPEDNADKFGSSREGYSAAVNVRFHTAGATRRGPRRAARV